MNSKDNAHEAFEKAFSKKHKGYVLITCQEPSASGEMKVEMTYGGSPDLANMLIDGAQTLLGDETDPSDLEFS